MRKFSEHNKDQCISKIKCIKCNKRFKEESELKNHLCGEHKTNSVSKSPPYKKKRNNEKENKKEELTEVTTNIDEMEVDIAEADIEMEIDVTEDNTEEINILVERSKQMDAKILAKAEKNEQEDLEYQNKKKLKEEEKKAADIALKLKMNAKKQKMKDGRKKSNKKQKMFTVPK